MGCLRSAEILGSKFCADGFVIGLPGAVGGVDAFAGGGLIGVSELRIMRVGGVEADQRWFEKIGGGLVGSVR